MTEALFIQFAALLASAMLIPAMVFLAHWINHKAMRFWLVGAASYGALFVGSSFGALRGVLPELATILISNGLIALGYFLCLRSLRLIKNEWRHAEFDAVTVSIFLVAFILVVSTNNTYEARVAVVAIFIAAMSLIAICLALCSRTQFSLIGDAAVGLFGIGNALTASLRAISALTGSPHTYLSLEFWDPVFFVWSIAAVFCFAIGFFINGTAVISRETHDSLEAHKKLGDDLAEALENQRNLQKLMLHEVKRPLNAISSAVQVMLAEPSASEEGLTSLRSLVQQANTYLEGIGDFEEINSLLDSPDLTAIKVAELADDLRNKWGVSIGMSQDVSETVIWADTLLMDIALSNLIENAQKYGTGAKPVAVLLSRHGDQLAFDVVDDGVGIPVEEADKVFGKFYKIGNASGNALKGCGLGLYVVHRIAEAHGGSAKVMSRTPSTLRFSIPTQAA